MRKYICEGLEDFISKDYRPWHMPGHKRKNFIKDISGEAAVQRAAFSAMSIDVTEVPGTDNLHNPQGMILNSMEELKKVYGTYASYYMVNGSTGGILAAVGAVAAYRKCKNKIIIARNCHKSVYNACEVFGLDPIYLEPEYLKLESKQEKYNSYIYGDIKPQQIKELVAANPDVTAVVITSPTYEGVMSDVSGIKKVLEPYDIPLIVDEAHGAHLPFIKGLPESAVALEADIVVQSLHKTLPAMTQTAILHVNNKRLDEGVRKYLSIFMSTSPSYVMLCSMEQAIISAWERKNSEHGYSEYLDALRNFRRQVSNLKNIKLLGKSQETDINGDYLLEDSIFEYDETRIVFYCEKSGEAFAKRLREIGKIEVEMSGTNYVVLISTYVDEYEDFMHLEKVIKLMDEELSKEDNQVHMENAFSTEELYNLVGTVAQDNIYVYPPGSYIVAEGEEITKSAVEKIIQLKASGKRIVGVRGE